MNGRRKDSGSSLLGEEGENTEPSSPPILPVGQEIASVEGNEAEVEPPGRLLVAEVVRQVGEPFLVGAPFLGTSSFTLPSSINLFANHLNVSGLDWVDRI